MYGIALPAFHRIGCPAALAFAALVLSLASPGLHAQANVTAVPEFIEFTEADPDVPAWAELASAQEAFRINRDGEAARAIRSAKDVVALARETYGDSHVNVARALTNLAIVQAEDRDFESAIENYTRAIDIRERASGTIVSADLTNPLQGLAGAYMSLGDIDRAIPTLERAIHITHVNEGPESLDQVDILDALSRVHYFNGDLDKSDDLQDAIFRLRARRADDNTDQYLDALRHRAEWHARLGKFSDAIRFYRRLVRAISNEYGKDDPRLVEPLLARADSASMYQDKWGGYAGGKRALSQAVKITRANESPARLALTLADQGDWFTARQKSRDARPPYQEAWQILDADPALHGVRDQLFARPVLILRSRMRAYYGVRDGIRVARPERFRERGFVLVRFDVDAFGRPHNVRVVDAEPAAIMDRHVSFRAREFRYRPALENGRPRAFEGLTYRHTFRYDPSALTPRDKKRIASTTYGDDPQPGG